MINLDYCTYAVNISCPMPIPASLRRAIMQKAGGYAVGFKGTRLDRYKRLTILQFKALSPEEASNFRKAASRFIVKYKKR